MAANIKMEKPNVKKRWLENRWVTLALQPFWPVLWMDVAEPGD